MRRAARRDDLHAPTLGPELRRSPGGPSASVSLIRDDTLDSAATSPLGPPSGTFPSEEVSRYAAALALPFVAHSAAEHYWFGRSRCGAARPLLQRRVGSPIQVPVLQVQTRPMAVLADATGGSQRYVGFTYPAIEARAATPRGSPDAGQPGPSSWLATVRPELSLPVPG